jgi:hypothetical protein
MHMLRQRQCVCDVKVAFIGKTQRAGAAQATGLAIHSPASWALIVSHPAAWVKLAVTTASAASLFYAINILRSPAALPGILVLIPALWYGTLGAICMVRRVSWSELDRELTEREWHMASPAGAHEQFWEVPSRSLSACMP